jgi:hypothetical protein
MQKKAEEKQSRDFKEEFQEMLKTQVALPHEGLKMVTSTFPRVFNTKS